MERGFTLVEALVALACFGAAFAAVVDLQAETLAVNGDARRLAQALGLAGGRLEWLRAAAPSGPREEAVTGSSSHPLPEGVMVERWRIDPVAWPGYRELSVEVEWQARNGRPQRVRLASALAERGGAPGKRSESEPTDPEGRHGGEREERERGGG